MTTQQRQLVLSIYVSLAFFVTLGAVGIVGDPLFSILLQAALGGSIVRLALDFGMRSKTIIDQSAPRLSRAPLIFGALVFQISIALSYQFGAFDGVEMSWPLKLGTLGSIAVCFSIILIAQTRGKSVSSPSILFGLLAMLASLAACWSVMQGYSEALIIAPFIWLAQIILDVNRFASATERRYNFVICSVIVLTGIAVVVIAFAAPEYARRN